MNVILWTGFFDRISNFRSIGAYQIAHWIRAHGYDCQVIDYIQHMTSEELINYTEKFINNNTLSIGLSSSFVTEFSKSADRRTLPNVMTDALKEIKKRYPNIKFVLGGGKADILYNEIYELFDYIVVGYGEDIFLELLNEWRTGIKKVFPTVSRAGRPYLTSPTQTTFNIENLQHRFLEQDCILEGESLPIETARGCIFKCSFCQYPYIGKTKLDYIRNFEYLKDELEYNYKNFKTTNYYILDDTFNDSMFKIENWNNVIQNLDFKINYASYLRADLIDRNPAQIEILKNTGLLSAFFGIESFHPEASRLVGKGWSGKSGKEFLIRLKETWKDQVGIHLSMIVGLPPETINDLHETLTWLTQSKVDSWVFGALSVTPGIRTFLSDLDRHPEKYGIKVKEGTGYWWTEYMNKNSAHALADHLNSLSVGRVKTPTWRGISLLGLGVTKEILNSTPYKDLPWATIEEKKQLNINEYKNKLKNLSV